MKKTKTCYLTELDVARLEKHAAKPGAEAHLQDMLDDVLERAVILAGEGIIQVAHLPAGFAGAPAPSGGIPSENGELRVHVGQTIEQTERALIELTLEHTRNNKTRAAEILGISQKTLFNKLKEYGAQGAG